MPATESMDEKPKASPASEKPDTETPPDPEEKFSQEIIDALRQMNAKIGTRDLVARRLQVKDAWKQRLMYRGFHRICDGPEGYSIGGESGLAANGIGSDVNQDEFRDCENIYFAYSGIICAALTGTKPSCQFAADNLNLADDLNAADNAEAARRFIERNNPIQEINSAGARYLFTDGVYYYWSWWDEETEQESIAAYGALEVKRPVSAKCLKDCAFLQLAVEKDRNILKEKFPEVADQITGANSGGSENQFDRIARISVNLGMGATACTGDSFTYLATEQTSWIRPSFYYEASSDEEVQKKLRKLFPNGVRITFVGTTFCEAVEQSIDECWTECFAFAGDGVHRPSIGSPLVPIQERLNDLLDILYAIFDYGIPWRWVSSEIDLNAIGDQENAPGMTGQVKTTSGRPLSDYFFLETQLSVPESMLTQIRALENEVAQLMVGAFPALFGGTDLGANAAVGTTTIQRDAALGRLGQIWRAIKSAYANCMEQAVLLAGEYRQGALSTEMPSAGAHESSTLDIDFDALNKGSFKAHTDESEGLPETWTTKRNTFMTLLMSAEKNPAGFAAMILQDPSNVAYAKYMVGLSDIVVPAEVSRNKQLQEIGKLLKGRPLPNPAVRQAQQMGQDPGKVPPEISSVPVNAVYDNHAVEFQEVADWWNSKEGSKQKIKNPNGVRNVELHGLEHQAIMKANAEANKPPLIPKESINVAIPLDKMAADVQAKILTMAGVSTPPEAIQQDLALKTQAKVVEKTLAHPAARALLGASVPQTEAPPPPVVPAPAPEAAPAI